MKKAIVLVSASALVLTLSAFKALNAQETQSANEAKSVAWYVANIQDARAKNQQCHDNPSVQSSEDCANALHALDISFKGGN